MIIIITILGVSSCHGRAKFDIMFAMKKEKTLIMRKFTERFSELQDFRNVMASKLSFNTFA